jgi:hypothetical protein
VIVFEVPLRSSLGRKNDRGDNSGGGRAWKLDDIEVAEDDLRVPGDNGDSGSGIARGENIMTCWFEYGKVGTGCYVLHSSDDKAVGPCLNPAINC